MNAYKLLRVPLLKRCNSWKKETELFGRSVVRCRAMRRIDARPMSCVVVRLEASANTDKQRSYRLAIFWAI